MNAVQIQFCILVLMTITGQFAAGQTHTKNIFQRQQTNSKEIDWHSSSSKPSSRFKRQTSTSTTPKPKKNRPSNLFSLISVLITETRQDASRAFNEIGTLFNSQFANTTTTTTKEPTTMTSTTPSSSSSDSDEENEIMTTTEPYRITRDEFLGILRSNVQGIVQLFGKELRLAIKDSNQNAREFGRDLGIALRPYFN